MHTNTHRIHVSFGTLRPGNVVPPGMDRTPGARDNGVMTTAPPSSRPRPQSLTDLFISFTWLALQGFGGVLAVVQRELVERKGWLTQDEFIEDWAVAQIMPGPNVVNLSMMIGGRYFGLAGAMAALAGMLALPLVLILLLALLHAEFAGNPHVAGALRGMAAVSAGLIGAAGLKLSVALARNPMPLAWCVAISAAGFVLVALLHFELIYVLFGLGGLGWVLTWRRLGA
jgi:chromate transporter